MAVRAGPRRCMCGSEFGTSEPLLVVYQSLRVYGFCTHKRTMLQVTKKVPPDCSRAPTNSGPACSFVFDERGFALAAEVGILLKYGVIVERLPCSRSI